MCSQSITTTPITNNVIQVEDLFAERHVVADHPPNIDIQRHTNYNIDPTRYINRPSIEGVKSRAAADPTKAGPSNGHVSWGLGQIEGEVGV